MPPRLGRLRIHIQPVLLIAAYLFGFGGVRAAYLIAAHSSGTSFFGLFWVGFLAVLIPTVVVGVRAETAEWTRWVLMGAYGLFTFMPKFLLSVSGPDYYDEFGHFRHAQDILAQGSVNVPDNFLPITKYYPGLEVLTDGVHLVTRLSVWHAGQVVVMAAHLLSIVVVWRLAVALGVPSRWGFVAGIIFSLNPSYMYFDTEFAYESLGLPMAMAAILFAVLARRSFSHRKALLWSAAALLTSCAVVFTHHISAGFVVLGLISVAILVPTQWSWRANRLAYVGPWIAGLVALAVLTVWVTTVARPTIGYVEPHVQKAISQLIDLVLRRKQPVGHPGNVPTGRGPIGAPAGSAGQPAGGSSRHLFAGSGLPTYEVIFGFLSPLLATALVVASLLQVWRFRGAWSPILRRLPFLLIGVAYLVTLPLDLTSSGSESAHRLWACTYIGVAICAVSGRYIWSSLAQRLRLSRPFMWATALFALVGLAIGNVASGENIDYRFPGPYVFGTDTRSRTPELFQLVRWCNAHIPKDTNVVTDRLTGEVIDSYTRLQIPSPSDSEIYKLYYEGNDATYGVRKYLRTHDFQYWILDLRIAYFYPQQKLFETYAGPASVDGEKLVHAGGTSFLHVVYQSSNYEVLAIHTSKFAPND